MKGLGMIFGILILIAVVLLIIPVITQWAWAHSVHSVFGIREITWVEAFAFNLLGTMLFRSSGIKYKGNK
jgi:hypothetical protein